MTSDLAGAGVVSGDLILKQLKAVAHVKSMNGGGSKAQLVQGSDGKYYVVKLIGNPQGTRILANEFVTGKLAQILDVPCPQVTTIEVDPVLVESINRLTASQFIAGIQFAQEYVGGSVQVFPSNHDLMVGTSNIAKWANSIVFDSLVQNEDLKDTHILVAVDSSARVSTFCHIDHGHCLGVTRGWGALNPDNATVRGPLYGSMVFGPDPFKDAFDRLDSMNVKIIEKAIGECPLEGWGVAPSEPGMLTSYLLSARDKVRDSIKASNDKFPNWKKECAENTA